METRSFRARSIEQALRKTRKELGPDAMVLSTKKSGGPFPMFEVTAWGNVAAEDKAQAPVEAPAVSANVPLDLEDTLFPIREELAGLRRMLRDLRVVTEQSVLPEFALIKHLIIDAALENEANRLLGPLYMDLVDRGVLPDYARDLIRTVEMELGLKQADHRDIITVGRGILKELLQTQVEVAGPIVPEKDKNAFVFLGPSGVGKTTTIAKLASRMVLSEGLDVVIVTTDTYRVGSVEQIRRYAELIGVPLVVAGKQEVLANAMRTHAKADVILIDTPGRSFENAEVREQLRQSVMDIPGQIEFHLLVSAAGSPKQQKLVNERFAQFAPSRLIVTKVDETAMSGGILNAHRVSGLPISYLTTGQRVPEDLEVARTSRVVEVLMEKTE